MTDNKLITFKPLAVGHFPLMLKWLLTPHVKLWWDQSINWTLQFIEEKYTEYVNKTGFHAFIICYDQLEIGYIQYYDKYLFPNDQEYDLAPLPSSLATFDWYIGEVDYIGKGLGVQILKVFLEDYIWREYENVIAEADANNLRAIRCYEKAGFVKMDINCADSVIMLYSKNQNSTARSGL